MAQTVFPCITFRDADASIEWMENALGAEVAARYTNDSGLVNHAEIRIGESTVMVGDERAGSKATPPGVSVVYVVVPDADAAYQRAKDAGAQVSEPVDQDYGSRDVSLTDPDGNRWSLGTYAGAGST
ncbi:MAG TPA: VOC family protein [Thermoleophilaceae bacterium]|jgi:uncharacterized glyoxalase superfamily protein PhnB|nr:VOC family protein [Thermoleophilaceae bacterium]